MKVTLKRDINHTYILFQGEPISTETFQVQMMLHNLVEGLLPCSIVSLNQEDVWRCECTGMQSLDTYCRTRMLGKEAFIWIVKQLMETIQELQDYLLDVNNLYLISEYIYIHQEKNRLLCCMVPGYYQDIWSSLKQVLQFLLQYLEPQDDAAASMAYGFFRMLSREDCSMELLWSFLYEEKHTWKAGKTMDADWQSNPFQAKDIKQSSDEFQGKDSRQPSDSFQRKDSRQPSDPFQRKDSRLSLDPFQGEDEKWLSDKVQKEDAEQLADKIQSKDAKRRIRHRLEEKKRINSRENTDTGLNKYRDINFWKKILYIFPALIAICLFLYLAFNSWTMSETTLLTFAGSILGFQALSLLFYWKWGRDIKEINPLMEEYAKAETGKMPSEDSDIGNTVLLGEASVQERYLLRLDTKERYELKSEEIIIGKSKEQAQIQLQEATVSRIHARLTMRKNQWYVQDLDSKNGTYKNGERLRVQKKYLLEPSDELRIANITFCFK